MVNRIRVDRKVAALPSARESKGDIARTRERILGAALAEFSARGYAGARIAAIARRARVNKRMLYYCVGPKHLLYREVLRRKIAEKAEAAPSIPGDFGGALLFFEELGSGDLDWIRMLEWEALAPQKRSIAAPRERRALFAQGVQQIRSAQRRGAVARGVDPEQLFLSIIALTVFPMAFPQMTRLCVGRGPRDRRFRAERRRFLRWLARHVSGAATRKRRARAEARRRQR
jgi:TetR/AcrR family transcriptional regulator